MNGAKYRQILDENLLQIANDIRLGRRFMFQPDNAFMFQPQAFSQSNAGIVSEQEGESP